MPPSMAGGTALTRGESSSQMDKVESSRTSQTRLFNNCNNRSMYLRSISRDDDNDHCVNNIIDKNKIPPSSSSSSSPVIKAVVVNAGVTDNEEEEAVGNDTLLASREDNSKEDKTESDDDINKKQNCRQQPPPPLPRPKNHHVLKEKAANRRVEYVQKAHLRKRDVIKRLTAVRQQPQQPANTSFRTLLAESRSIVRSTTIPNSNNKQQLLQDTVEKNDDNHNNSKIISSSVLTTTTTTSGDQANSIDDENNSSCNNNVNNNNNSDNLVPQASLLQTGDNADPPRDIISDAPDCTITDSSRNLNNVVPSKGSKETDSSLLRVTNTSTLPTTTTQDDDKGACGGVVLVETTSRSERDDQTPPTNENKDHQKQEFKQAVPDSDKDKQIREQPPPPSSSTKSFRPVMKQRCSFSSLSLIDPTIKAQKQTSMQQHQKKTPGASLLDDFFLSAARKSRQSQNDSMMKQMDKNITTTTLSSYMNRSDSSIVEVDDQEPEEPQKEAHDDEEETAMMLVLNSSAEQEARSNKNYEYLQIHHTLDDIHSSQIVQQNIGSEEATASQGELQAGGGGIKEECRVSSLDDHSVGGQCLRGNSQVGQEDQKDIGNENNSQREDVANVPATTDAADTTIPLLCQDQTSATHDLQQLNQNTDSMTSNNNPTCQTISEDAIDEKTTDDKATSLDLVLNHKGQSKVSQASNQVKLITDNDTTTEGPSSVTTRFPFENMELAKNKDKEPSFSWGQRRRQDKQERNDLADLEAFCQGNETTIINQPINNENDEYNMQVQQVQKDRRWSAWWDEGLKDNAQSWSKHRPNTSIVLEDFCKPKEIEGGEDKRAAFLDFVATHLHNEQELLKMLVEIDKQRNKQERKEQNDGDRVIQPISISSGYQDTSVADLVDKSCMNEQPSFPNSGLDEGFLFETSCKEDEYENSLLWKPEESLPIASTDQDGTAGAAVKEKPATKKIELVKNNDPRVTAIMEHPDNSVFVEPCVDEYSSQLCHDDLSDESSVDDGEEIQNESFDFWEALVAESTENCPCMFHKPRVSKKKKGQRY